MHCTEKPVVDYESIQYLGQKTKKMLAIAANKMGAINNKELTWPGKRVQKGIEIG
jgi:hypothetical protein